ncbi:hypothetical protein ABIB81_009638 [Bradyrhizobium sp. I1.7.5]
MLAVDDLEFAEQSNNELSGDGDFRSLVEAVQRRGVRVTVISTIASQPPMIADELRRQADVFADLVELQSKLGRDPSERPALTATRDAVIRQSFCKSPKGMTLPSESLACGQPPGAVRIRSVTFGYPTECSFCAVTSLL